MCDRKLPIQTPLRIACFRGPFKMHRCGIRMSTFGIFFFTPYGILGGTGVASGLGTFAEKRRPRTMRKVFWRRLSSAKTPKRFLSRQRRVPGRKNPPPPQILLSSQRAGVGQKRDRILTLLLSSRAISRESGSTRLLFEKHQNNGKNVSPDFKRVKAQSFYVEFVDNYGSKGVVCCVVAGRYTI